MKWEPKRRGLVSGHGPVPKTPPPPVSSVMPARHCTPAYYEKRIADLEADLCRKSLAVTGLIEQLGAAIVERDEAYAHGVNDERKASAQRAVKYVNEIVYFTPDELAAAILNPTLGDGAALQAASQADAVTAEYMGRGADK